MCKTEVANVVDLLNKSLHVLTKEGSNEVVYQGNIYFDEHFQITLEGEGELYDGNKKYKGTWKDNQLSGECTIYQNSSEDEYMICMFNN